MGYALAAALGKLPPHGLRRSCAKVCRKAGGDLKHIHLLLDRLYPDHRAYLAQGRSSVRVDCASHLFSPLRIEEWPTVEDVGP
jgi:hypothetical protein